MNGKWTGPLLLILAAAVPAAAQEEEGAREEESREETMAAQEEAAMPDILRAIQLPNVAEILRERSIRYAREAPPPDWAGVEVYTEK